MFETQDLTRQLKEQSPHAENLVASPDAGPTGRCAPSGDFIEDYGQLCEKTISLAGALE